jgi:hypothetical protein
VSQKQEEDSVLREESEYESEEEEDEEEEEEEEEDDEAALAEELKAASSSSSSTPMLAKPAGPKKLNIGHKFAAHALKQALGKRFGNKGGVPPLPGRSSAKGIPPLPGSSSSSGATASAVPPLPGSKTVVPGAATGIPPLPGTMSKKKRVSAFGGRTPPPPPPMQAKPTPTKTEVVSEASLQVGPPPMNRPSFAQAQGPSAGAPKKKAPVAAAAIIEEEEEEETADVKEAASGGYADPEEKPYSLKQLTTGTLPADVDPAKREMYLPEIEFLMAFKVSKELYSTVLPAATQHELKKKLGLTDD